MKTTSNGRRPQNQKSWISQKPLLEPSSNFKLNLKNVMLEMKTTTHGRGSQISKVEYLRKYNSKFKPKLRGH